MILDLKYRADYGIEVMDRSDVGQIVTSNVELTRVQGRVILKRAKADDVPRKL